MIALVPFSASLAFLLLAGVVARRPDAAQSRSLAITWTGIIWVATSVTTLAAPLITGPVASVEGIVRLLPPPGVTLAPSVFCLLGLVVVSLAPLASHPPKTLARILVLLAGALATVATDNHAIVVALFLSCALVAWLEMRSQPLRDVRAAKLFAYYHSASGFCVLVGTMMLSLGHDTVGIPLVVAGIAIREAVLPVHSWFPAFVESCPLGVVAAFVAPQLGVYAHLALLADGIPGDLAHQVAAVGAVTAVGAAGLGVVQTDARRALAFLIMSQTGLVAFGLENESLVARTGALLTWQVLALATTGYIMCLAALGARRGSLSLKGGGSFARTPRLAAATLILGLASVGFPLTLGFVAEDLLIQGSVQEFPVLGLTLILATAINGMTALRCFFSLFSGSLKHQGELDLRPRERNALTVLLLALLLAGTFPATVLPLIEPVAPHSLDHSQLSADHVERSARSLFTLRRLIAQR